MNSEERELFREMDTARLEYMELRDAKSNGCLGWCPRIAEVFEYDQKIIVAHEKYIEARNKWEATWKK